MKYRTEHKFSTLLTSRGSYRSYPTVSTKPGAGGLDTALENLIPALGGIQIVSKIRYQEAVQTKYSTERSK
jgi:hypothetical protein